LHYVSYDAVNLNLRAVNENKNYLQISVITWLFKFFYF
jgi:hypothetical protein